jgi:hypothetical protein
VVRPRIVKRAFVLFALVVLAACTSEEPAVVSTPAGDGSTPPPSAPADADDPTVDASAPDTSEASSTALPCGPIPTSPFETVQSDEGPECVVYRPKVLGTGHPPIVWGNGTGAVVSVYEAAFQDWAKNGFVVAAAKTSNGQGAGKALVDCLDHVMKTYAANVCARAGASGHSQGGGGAIMAGRDPRIVATAPVQPYIQQGYGGFDQASITTQAQGAAMLLLSGSADDNAVPATHQKPVFDKTNAPVFWATLSGGDHYFSAYGLSSYREIALAWFRLQLMGDEAERANFYGPSCTYCTNPKWTVSRRGM